MDKKVYLKDVKEKINKGQIKAYVEFQGTMYRILGVSSNWWVRVSGNAGFGRSFCSAPEDIVYIEGGNDVKS